MPAREKGWQMIAFLRWSKVTGEIDERYAVTPEATPVHRRNDAELGITRFSRISW
jgi:hypothetical protein